MNPFSRPLLIATAAAAGFLLAAPITQAEPILKPNDFVAVGGDSITEIHRYSTFMEDYLLMCKPVENVRLAQFGWGGTSADHFLKRVETDILPWHPTVVTVCFGMNDGRFPDGHAKALTPAAADNFRTNLTAIVQKLKAGGVRAIVLGSPGVVDSFYYKFQVPSPDPAVPIDVIYNKTLADLGGIAKEIAEKEGVFFADVHAAMAEAMPKAKAAFGERYVFAGGDGIHPKASGSLVMAYAFLKGLGCDGAIGTITVDLAANKATGTPGQQILSVQNGTVQVESTRYPFCFQGDPSLVNHEETTSEIIKVFPFNEELNRYLLVVTGVGTPRAKVTWGSESKEFSCEDLAKGINLAAEFIKGNPFADQFAKVHHAVQVQQQQDLDLIKTFLPSLPAFKKMVPPDKAPLIDTFAEAAKAHELTLFQNAAALVVPVQHTLKIEPVR